MLNPEEKSLDCPSEETGLLREELRDRSGLKFLQTSE